MWLIVMMSSQLDMIRQIREWPGRLLPGNSCRSRSADRDAGGSRQACRRCGVMIRASGNSAANWAAAPNSAPMRSVYLRHVLRHLVGRGEPRDMLGGPVDADDVPADIGDVESQGHPRVVADAALLDLRCLAVNEDGLVVAARLPWT
jgi:hypothetical protein